MRQTESAERQGGVHFYVMQRSQFNNLRRLALAQNTFVSTIEATAIRQHVTDFMNKDAANKAQTREDAREAITKEERMQESLRMQGLDPRSSHSPLVRHFVPMPLDLDEDLDTMTQELGFEKNDVGKVITYIMNSHIKDNMPEIAQWQQEEEQKSDAIVLPATGIHFAPDKQPNERAKRGLPSRAHLVVGLSDMNGFTIREFDDAMGQVLQEEDRHDDSEDDQTLKYIALRKGKGDEAREAMFFFSPQIEHIAFLSYLEQELMLQLTTDLFEQNTDVLSAGRIDIKDDNGKVTRTIRGSSASLKENGRLDYEQSELYAKTVLTEKFKPFDGVTIFTWTDENEPTTI